MWLALPHRKLETRCSAFSQPTSQISTLCSSHVRLSTHPTAQPLQDVKASALCSANSWGPRCLMHFLGGMSGLLHSFTTWQNVDWIDGFWWFSYAFNWFYHVSASQEKLLSLSRQGWLAQQQKGTLLSQKGEISQYNRTAVTQKVGLRLQSPQGLVSWILF